MIDALVVALIVVSLVALAAIRAWWQARQQADTMTAAYFHSLTVIVDLGAAKGTAEAELAILKERSKP